MRADPQMTSLVREHAKCSNAPYFPVECTVQFNSIQGIIFINLKKKKKNWVKKRIFLALNRTVVLRAKIRPKIGKIRQNPTGWQV
jgi:MoxR-like ATPase